MALKGKFRTAYDQRELPMDVKVSADLVVGQLVTLSADGTTISAASTKTAATHMVAQSDMTLEYGHIPVEDRDYRYSDKVAASTSAPKKVALFALIDKNDVVEYTV